MITLFKSFLINGISLKLGGYKIFLKVTRVSNNKKYPILNAMMIRQVEHLRRKYPELNSVNLSLNEKNAQHIYDFYCAYIPSFSHTSREAYLRVLLNRLKKVAEDEVLEVEIEKEIAKSNLRNSIPHRAQILASDVSVQKELINQTQAAEKEYGAPLISEAWPGCGRDESLLLFFKNNNNLLKGKNVLHFSPEHGLSIWLKNNSKKLEIDYTTTDICGSNVDYYNDITNLSFSDNVFDFIICHRVLEHVLDDVSAIKEMYRVLKPGGCLQISVPESLHVATNDWIIPDTTHDHHVRHYGKDFVDRLATEGFSVTCEKWLLSRERSELLNHNAFPLRMYNAIK